MNEPVTELELNVPLLTKVLDHVTAHPEEWNQTVWAVEHSCGTACCVAGWAAVMAGYELKFDGSAVCGCGCTDALDGDTASYTTTGEFISDVAQRELGLTESQAKTLFSGCNGLDTLWSLANAYSDGEIERLEVTA